MTRPRIGKQPAKYNFLLNPHADIRLSKCPTCDRPTHPRKFALLINAEGWGPLTLGKTGKYCARCELIIVHKDELDAEMSHCLARLAPDAVGRQYIVLGTMDRRVWQKGLNGASQPLAEALESVADFKKVLKIEVDRGGWRPAEESMA